MVHPSSASFGTWIISRAAWQSLPPNCVGSRMLCVRPQRSSGPRVRCQPWDQQQLSGRGPRWPPCILVYCAVQCAVVGHPWVCARDQHTPLLGAGVHCNTCKTQRPGGACAGQGDAPMFFCLGIHAMTVLCLLTKQQMSVGYNTTHAVGPCMWVGRAFGHLTLLCLQKGVAHMLGVPACLELLTDCVLLACCNRCSAVTAWVVGATMALMTTWLCTWLQ
jgi:hypothetical protein